ncbi:MULTISPECIES: hypothetical protein [Acinetobacter]|nr:hypothetical protein [Acinetobacter bereziniae]MCU4314426.1 hypothetical protein [Acinetobacter bereziniae]MDQ9820817.1 hypothetical protein [Acinetobacter bereziniae]
MLNSSQAKAEAYSKEQLKVIVISDGKANNAVSAQAWLTLKSNEQIATYMRNIPADKLNNLMNC